VIWVNTWGISGSFFLLIYAGLLIATWAWVLAARQRAGGTAGTSAAIGEGPLELGPYEVAMLNGGGRLALAAAVCQLKENGSLTLNEDGKSLVVSEPLPANADPVEGWLYDCVKNSAAAAAPQVLDEASAEGVLGPIRDRLRGLGLMPTDRQVVSMRWQVLWFAPLLILGAARVIAGTANHHPVFFLVVLMLVSLGIAISLARQPPDRVLSTSTAARLFFLPRTTGAGMSLLKSLRTQVPGGEDSSVPGSGRLAGQVALTGIGALVLADVALASMLGPVAGSGWSGSGFGGGGTSCGGGGGGCGGGGGGCGG
jgi:uncharacterized protein (TIGR04222 family)